MKRMVFLLAQIFALPVAAQTADGEPDQVDNEFHAQDIRSDLPLYTFDWPDLWPRNFVDGDTFGCESRVAFGDWQVTWHDNDEQDAASWSRITNYGVFHCAAFIGDADDRAELADAEVEIVFFVKLGESDRDGSMVELWAMQEGTVPGSRYILLAREPGDGRVERFSILQSRCPEGAMRRLEGDFDVWRTSYCVINTREDLLALASAMVALPPMATIARSNDTAWVLHPDEANPEDEPEGEEEVEPGDGSWLLDEMRAPSE